MNPNLKDIKKHLAGIPERRLPLGKNAWLQEWQETKELVEAFEKKLQEKLQIEIENHKTAAESWHTTNYPEPRDLMCYSNGRRKLLKELLGEK